MDAWSGMDIWIVNGRVLCPASGLDSEGAVELSGGTVRAVHPGGASPPAGAEVIDAGGGIVCPAFVDLHCRLGEPGEEHKEDLETGGRAAVRGGFGTICPSSDTTPANDNRSVTEHLVRRGAELGSARVRPVAALTVGREGRRLTEMFDLHGAGAVAFGDGGRSVADAGLLRRGLEYARAVGAPVFERPEDVRLAHAGVMHEGEVATRLGLKGLPSAAEEVAVLRAIVLAELTGARVHLGPISAGGSVRAIRDAKRRGLPVTCAVTAAHLHLADEAIAVAYDTNLRVSPPLRSRSDLEALREGVADGTIDAIASGHAPQSAVEKAVEFDVAEPGMIGLETTLGLVLRLVEAKAIGLSDAIARLTCGAAAVLGIDAGRLTKGAPADVTVFDPTARARVEAGGLASRSRNSPFVGQALPGRVAWTLVGGRVVCAPEGPGR